MSDIQFLQSSNRQLPASLIETIKVPLSERQRRVMDVIDSEEYVPVCTKVRYELGLQRKCPTEEYMAEGVLALKQYYAICFMDENAHAISSDLDPFWHAHILHTVPYHRFSERLGIGYMHHAPNDVNNSSETAALRVLYDHTQAAFVHCFNWISPIFNPKGDENQVLLCAHYSQNAFVLPGDIALPALAHVAAAERLFVESRQIPFQ